MGKTGGMFSGTMGAAEARLPHAAGPRERLVHLAWAVILSSIMAVAMFLEPVDWMIWNFQSRVSNHKPSGEIVFIQADSSLSDPNAPSQRVKLANALDRMRAAGAKRVFVDAVFSEPANAASADERLVKAIEGWGPRITFVDRFDITPGGEQQEYRSLAKFRSGGQPAWAATTRAWPEFTFKLPYAFATSEGPQPTLAARLADRPGKSFDEFQINYGYRSRSIPMVFLNSLADPSAKESLTTSLSGKTLVIGAPRNLAQPELSVPAQFASPPSFVSIYAAETLKAGPPSFMPSLAALMIVACLLLPGALASRRSSRRLAYALATAVPVLAVALAPEFGLRVELSYCLPLLAMYAAMRWRVSWKRRIAEIDPDTGLPSLRALSLNLAQHGGGGYVVVAKVHGYEAILKSLEAEHRSSYMMKLVERIRVGDARMTVYVDGHYLAWRVNLPNEARLREHLEGLRAIFAAPVTVEARSIDVGITFGAAAAEPGEAQRSVAAALAAVEETTEALEPIKLADDSADSDTLWDLSLRARIDAAMEAGEVFCVYQPKIDISEDKVIGVEALVRWEDPERGFIPPMHFVMQCEKAGRMEYLTRYVLQSACSAAKLLHFRGNRITMSVNISATLLTDMRIVGIVRNVLQATGFDPNYLVLEITETARIRDLTQARTVLKALKALGAHLSMDDFGVGAANFEALQALPFDEIKIDRQFVSRAASSSKARAITASIVGLGTSARIAVVAEGAETESDLQMLRDIGCWQVQGFALARPMPLTKLLTFMGGEGDQHQAVMV
jgi:EAL domain-containing protein (putative c-di-GMP-specific phosphodiesterase class I)